MAVATLWCGPRRVAYLSDDGRPTMSLVEAAGLTFRGEWSPTTRYAAGDLVTYEGRGYRRDLAVLAGTPGQGVGWSLIDETALLELVADRWTAINGGVRPTVRAIEVVSHGRASGLGRDSGAAGSATGAAGSLLA